MSGRLAVVGLGPGDARQLTPEAADALAAADALYGYGPYLARAPARPGQERHASDNREEARAATALGHAAARSERRPGLGRRSRRVCDGGGSVRRDRERAAAWRELDLMIVPGITAMLAVAARIGAPLGHDFCALSLSDNLKSWELIERRLERRGRRRLRPCALQSGLARPPLAAWRGAGTSAAAASGDHARRVRPRRRPA
ncbi:MAG: SAM-dependent methyltransferase [Xanthobacteraceae bacterium]